MSQGSEEPPPPAPQYVERPERLARSNSIHNPVPQLAPGSSAAVGHVLGNSIPLSIFPISDDKICFCFCGLPGLTTPLLHSVTSDRERKDSYCPEISEVIFEKSRDLADFIFLDIFPFSMPFLCKYSTVNHFPIISIMQLLIFNSWRLPPPHVRRIEGRGLV
jgi:hypothetical protein